MGRPRWRNRQQKNAVDPSKSTAFRLYQIRQAVMAMKAIRFSHAGGRTPTLNHSA
jgi:hypothetical protein